MAEKLTWDEIKKQYPDEWVILVNLDRNGDDDAVQGGEVFAHSKNKKDLLASTKMALAGQSRAVRFTGEVARGGYLIR
ncbi:MAG: hypothetical protein HY815_01745 [Candidatus Riflebacteria bacterium]|nr:hypothetical protein [Candidatus Riflebacteria bacterium]